MYEVLKQTAIDFIHSYEQELCGTDIAALSRCLTADCMRYFQPQSLLERIPALIPSRTNSEYEAQVAPEFQHVFTTW